MSTSVSTPETMRAWARGAYDTEAGVELLIRSGLAERGYLWAWSDHLDPERYVDVLDRPWSGGERRVGFIAGNLLGIDACATIALDDVLSGLDRWHLHLVLAALAHAGGSHEHGAVSFADDGLPLIGEGYLPPLLDWPAPRA